MKNKSLYLSLSIFSAFFLGTVGASTSFATIPSDKAKEAFSGFYVTGSVGHSYLSAKKDSSFSTPGSFIAGGRDMSSNSFLGSLDIGASQLLDSTYLALEATIFRDGHRAKSVSSSIYMHGRPMIFTERLNRQYGIGIRSKAGFQMTDHSILYGSLGIDCSKFSVHGKLNGYESKLSKKLWAITPGVGIKTFLSEKLSLDLNYSYSIYQNFKNMASVGGAQLAMKIAPRVSMARIGLSIKL
ncbi:MAG: outer membrane protein [Alphaproteobacteria bacterium]